MCTEGDWDITESRHVEYVNSIIKEVNSFIDKLIDKIPKRRRDPIHSTTATNDETRESNTYPVQNSMELEDFTETSPLISDNNSAPGDYQSSTPQFN